MNLRLRHRDGEFVVEPVELEGPPPTGYREIRVERTLLDLSDPSLVAVTGVARPPMDGERVVALTDQLQDSVFAQEETCIPLDHDDQELSSLLLPFVIEGLLASQAADPDFGWDCLILGSGIRASVLSMLAPLAGARRVSSTVHPRGYFERHPPDPEWPGTHVVMVATGDNRLVESALSSAPERSVLVLLGGQSDRHTVGVNFYETVHRKNTTLVGANLKATQPLAQRARKLLRMRLEKPIEPKTVRLEQGSRFTKGDGLLLLDWTSPPGTLS